MPLEELNEEQFQAVTTTEGFVRIIAGAGSGKTKALSNRFAYLVNEIGILPSNILCVTFTNKAAAEMRSRIRKLTDDNDTGFISTFHGFCVSVLQEDSNAVSYPKSFLVLDNSDIDSMLDIIYDERNLTLRQMTYSNARDMIEMRKLFKEPDYYQFMIKMSLDEIHQKYLNAQKPDDIIFYGYLYQEKKCFGLDYNDLLKFVLYIFQTNEEIKLKWQKRLEYIMIDEFQDIDAIQYELMSVLCDYHKNLFVVGDPDQTIYTWRGADIRYLLDFDKNFENVKTIIMNKNYRSTPEILNAANTLINKNKIRINKELKAADRKETSTKVDASTASKSAGKNATTAENTCNSNTPTDFSTTSCKPEYFHAKTAEKEAEFIADEIERLQKQGFSYHQIVILYRAHHVSRTIEEIFQKRKIPYSLNSGVPFFNRAEIKDSLSYLRMITYKDDLSFLRIANKPKRNLGERRIAALKEYAAEHKTTLYNALKACADTELFSNTKSHQFIDLIEKYSSSPSQMQISELFNHLIYESGYETALRTEGSQERLDNLAELKQSIYEYETSCGEECNLENYLTHAALFTNADIESKKDDIRLMTVHTAKGLEFSVVFLAGMNENIFPSKKTDSQAAMEEERRLAFVAVTRAQQKLYVSDAEGLSNGYNFRIPSRFIFDMEDSLNYLQPLPENLLNTAKKYIELNSQNLQKIQSLSSLQINDRVKHNILGTGIIIQIDQTKHNYTIQFDQIPTPRIMSFKAPLTKI